jgi:hypothetical protein
VVKIVHSLVLLFDYLLCLLAFILLSVFYYFYVTVNNCLDLIVFCNLPLIVTSSISSPVCADNGSVKL